MSVPNNDHATHTPSGQSGGWGVVPRFLRGKLTANEIAIYVALTWRVNDDTGEVFIKQKRLAEEAGMSSSTAQRALNSLWEKGIVRWKPRYGPDNRTVICNTYKIRLTGSETFKDQPRPTFPERGEGPRKAAEKRREDGSEVTESTDTPSFNMNEPPSFTGNDPLIQNERTPHSQGMTVRTPMYVGVSNDKGRSAEAPRPPHPPIGDSEPPAVVRTENPPTPASGGACSRHPNNDGINCRGCGTTNRQRAKNQSADALALRRQQDAEELRRARENKPDPSVAARGAALAREALRSKHSATQNAPASA